MARHSDLKAYVTSPLEQTIHVLIKGKQLAVYQAQTFPDAVTRDESAVEYRDCRPIPGNKVAVDIEQYIFVAGIWHIGLCAVM